MKNWLRVEWSLFWGWSLILKLGQISRVNDPYRKSAIREGFAKDHDPYKKWVYLSLGQKCLIFFELRILQASTIKNSN